MGTTVEGSGRTTAAFFDLDKTIIARSSTLAFAPSFYRHGLITRGQVCRGAVAQLSFRLAGASHDRMERIRDQVSALCCGWPADVVAQIVTDGLRQTIVPHVYAEARSLLARHLQDGHDVIIVSTSGQEIASGADPALMAGSHRGHRDQASRFPTAEYTGSVAFYAYGQAKADHVSALATSRGYQLA